MAYKRSLREIPLEEDPHASVLEAVVGTAESPAESPGSIAGLTDDQLSHLAQCEQCREFLGIESPNSIIPTEGEVV
jgi:hypothetical protein